MIPLRLVLSEFTSYKHADVDFEGLNLVGLSGPNGAGKSSLIDAMLFALFGQSSKGAGGGGLDNHVRAGATRCVVQLTIEVSGRRYLVERVRDRQRQATTLRLWRLHGGDREAEEIGGKTVAAVQARIEELIGVDYRGFVSSSLILQGESDALTAGMSDAQRRALLQQTLGLSSWGAYLERATAARMAADTDAIAAERRLAELRERLAELPAMEARVAELQGHRAAAVDRVEALRRRAESLRVDDTERGALATQIDHATRTIAELRATVDRTRRECQARVAKGLELQATIGARQSLIATAPAVMQAALDVVELERAHAAASSALAAANASYQTATEALRDVDRQLRELAQAEQHSARQIASAEQELKRADDDAQLLGQVPCRGTDLQPRCQLLAAAIASAGRAETLRQTVSGLRAAVIVGPDVGGLRERLQEQQATAKREAEATDLPGISVRLAKARKLAAGAGGIQAAQVEIATAQQRLAEILAESAELEQEGRAAAAAQENEERALAEYRRRLATIDEQLAAYELAKRELADHEATLAEFAGPIGAAVARVEDRRALLPAAASVEESLPGLRSAAAAAATLARACRPDGVPALIVEHAVPAIEQLADDLLNRLSLGRFGVRLVTQRATKAGHLTESLRFLVVDAGQERPYETYSGAERFLVDLSLRVGFSRFLASRRGAQVQFLVVDEGIAAADEQNRERIVEALQQLAREFALVVVVTHLADVRDGFAERIEVTPQGVEGSTAVVRKPTAVPLA